MRILFVNPPRVAGYPVVREERFEHKDIGSVYPPLSLLYCASVVEKAGHEAMLLDLNGQDRPLADAASAMESFKPAACMIRLGFDTQEQDLEVLREAKRRGITTMARLKIVGDTPWLRDEFMKAHGFVDLFFLDEPECLLEPLLSAMAAGEGLETVPGLLLRKGDEVLQTPDPGSLMAPDALPRPAYHLLESLAAYHTGVMQAPFTVIQTSRGCPYTCSFCSFGKLPYRKRAIESVVEELEWLKRDFGLKSFLFFDDVLTLDKPRTEKLMRMMIERKLDLEWVVCTRADTVTKELLQLMHQAGCREIAFGIESGSDQVLADTTKGVTKDEIRQAAKWCHDAGILFYGLAIIGLPGETRQSVEDTIAFINEIEPFYTQFGYCTPFPNTDTWDWYKSRGYLSTTDWGRFFPLSQRPIVRTEALSEDDLVALRRRMYLKTMLRPGKLLRAVRMNDWGWNISRAAKFLGRLGMVARGSAVR
jgi:anaerobic magnesium-protoporphyrin IX monomethyl ester cyclase